MNQVKITKEFGAWEVYTKTHNGNKWYQVYTDENKDNCETIAQAFVTVGYEKVTR